MPRCEQRQRQGGEALMMSNEGQTDGPSGSEAVAVGAKVTRRAG